MCLLGQTAQSTATIGELFPDHRFRTLVTSVTVALMSLQGKTMFISGASRGIGLAIAKRAAQDGANIALIA
jgi:hypothetical protein